MCFKIIDYRNRPEICLANLTSWLKAILLLIIGGLFVLSLQAQGGGPSVVIPTLDMRGQQPINASIQAIKNSRNDVVVVLVRGGSEALIDKTKAQLRALAYNGYERIGVILCDLNPDEKGAVIAVVSDGTAFGAIKGALPDTRTARDTYELVREAYEKDIWPKMAIKSKEK